MSPCYSLLNIQHDTCLLHEFDRVEQLSTGYECDHIWFVVYFVSNSAGPVAIHPRTLPTIS